MDLLKAVSSAVNKGSSALEIEDVFSTYVYDGNSATQDIVNGVNLLDEGGMVWGKSRTAISSHGLVDTVRGVNSSLTSDSTASASGFSDITSFNTDGYSLAYNTGKMNQAPENFVSWTFRKAPRFFDVVTYTGDGNTSKTLSHNLGVPVGMMTVKSLGVSSWQTYHKSLGATKVLVLEHTNAEEINSTRWNDTEPTTTEFTVGASSNSDGVDYVAYLFADDPLGPSGDGSDGLIACGSYTGNGLADGPAVDLGWEPQYVIVKRSDSAGTGWSIFDSMRGVVTGGNDNYVQAQSSGAETAGVLNALAFNATGFKLEGTDGTWNASGGTYIYMAIRRPMRTPESSDEVFAVDTRYSQGGLPTYQSNFIADCAIEKRGIGSDSYVYSRLTQGKELAANATSIEATTTNRFFDYMNGFGDITGASSNEYSWMWKRATGFFDVVCYTGDGIAGRTVDHNLGVVPEMMWIKRRSASEPWTVYSADLTSTYFLQLNSTISKGTDSLARFNGTEPTDSVFTLGTDSATNISGSTYIAYIFSSLAGISKVGSYTGNGANQTIDCGFSAGAKFVLIKRTDDTGDWYMWDSVRGIVAGNDPHLSLNTTAAEVTTDDSIDPDTTGFIVNQVAATNINVNSAEYIFYAVAI